jgi:hypothetical protein
VFYKIPDDGQGPKKNSNPDRLRRLRNVEEDTRNNLRELEE